MPKGLSVVNVNPLTDGPDDDPETVLYNIVGQELENALLEAVDTSSEQQTEQITLLSLERNAFELRLGDQTVVAKVVLDLERNGGMGEFLLFLPPRLDGQPAYTDERFTGSFRTNLIKALERALDPETPRATQYTASLPVIHSPTEGPQ